MKLLNALLLVAASLLWSCSPVDVSGGQTSNQASVGITVFRADGKTVASGATIKLFTPGDTSITPIDQRELDENGQYVPSELTLNGSSPYYNVVIEYDSTEALFYDSLFITKENLTYLKDDTLAPVGAITGIVKIQPNHTPIAVLVHALGTDIYTKADGETGEFTIGGLGEGEYNLMFTCSYDDYDVELFDTVAISGRTTVIPDTIEIPYLNIPVVEGIGSSYDTLAGAASVSWESTGYSPALFAGYEVFKTTDLTSWPSTPIAIVKDTLFTDTLSAFGEDSIYYRVRVINQSGVSGLPFGVAAIKPVAPTEAITVFTTSLFHVKKQKTVTACSINDSMTVHFGFSNPSRTFTDLSVSNVEYEKELAAPVNSFSDSVSLFVTHDTSVVITATDDHGKIWSETVVIDVVTDAPRIISVDSVVSLNVLDTIHALVEDEYGEIVKYEWDLDGDGVFEKETTVPFVEVLISNLNPDSFRIRCTDDEGNTTISQMQKIELKIIISFSGVLEDNITPIDWWAFDNDTVYYSYNYSQGLFLKFDSETHSFNKIENNLKNIGYYVYLSKINEQFYLLDYSNHPNDSMTLYKSPDMSSWTQIAKYPPIGTLQKPSRPILFTKDNYLYSNFIDDTAALYKSTDGMSWVKTGKELYVFGGTEGYWTDITFGDSALYTVDLKYYDSLMVFKSYNYEELEWSGDESEINLALNGTGGFMCNNELCILQNRNQLTGKGILLYNGKANSLSRFKENQFVTIENETVDGIHTVFFYNDDVWLVDYNFNLWKVNL